MPKPRIVEFGYGDVKFDEGLHEAQFQESTAFLMELSIDSMLKPYRERAGLPAPGNEIGGWYENYPEYDYRSPDGRGFAPGHCFGQWLSALSRAYAITKDKKIRAKVCKIVRCYEAAISPKFYEEFRFPAYTYDKIVLGLLDAYWLVGLKKAMKVLHKTTRAALPYLPKIPTEHGDSRAGHEGDPSFTWDEPYTISENLFLAFERGAGCRYRDLAKRLLLDERFYNPLARGEPALVGKHAYSHVNSLCSAIKAYLVLGDKKHLDAAKNAFEFIRTTQSYATGGWGPNESFYTAGTGALFDSLSSTHNNFETPCGSYAHFKLTRYLLRITEDSRYGDSMERVMYNTILGAKQFSQELKAFYYSDNNFQGRKVYHKDNCPCCAGTLPQIACDYRISTYFRDHKGVYVNLYINSAVKWKQDGADVVLKQTGKYPHWGLVRFDLEISEERAFTLRFRIPEWLDSHAYLLVNGRPVPKRFQPGKWADIHRVWKDGDVIKLRMPLRARLEAIDEQHPNTVALMRGPLVLFPLVSAPPVVTKVELLKVRPSQDRPDEWVVKAGETTITLRPFTSITDEQYTTYVNVSD